SGMESGMLVSDPSSCQALIVHEPAGTPSKWKTPSLPVMAPKPESTTIRNPTICGWMLQSTRAGGSGRPARAFDPHDGVGCVGSRSARLRKHDPTAHGTGGARGAGAESHERKEENEPPDDGKARRHASFR